MENLLLFYPILGFAGGFGAECCVIPVIIIAALLVFLYYLGNKETMKKEKEQEELLREEKQREIRERMLQIEEKERADRWNKKYDRFSKSPEYVFVEQFVIKYQSRDSQSDRGNLQQLLKAKEWDFSNEELKILLEKEQKMQRSDDAKYKILLNKPFNEQEVIESYLNFHRSDDEELLNALKEVLEENHAFTGSLAELRQKVMEIERQIKIQNFEMRLLTENRLIAIKDIDRYNGYEFEAFLKELFEKMGYQVEQTKLSGDQGADLVVVKFGEKTVIQAKRFGAKVGNSAVQEIMAAISLYEAQKGMVVTNNYFTPAAVKLALANGIKLIDRDALEDLIKNNW